MPSYGGLWDGVYGTPYAPLNEPTSTERSIARLMAPQALVGHAAVAAALTGSAVGAAASASVTQVQARQADGFNLGGLVPIAAKVYVSRPTEVADETRFDAQLKPVWAPNPYPVDKSGNGGGGKVGTL